MQIAACMADLHLHDAGPRGAQLIAASHDRKVRARFGAECTELQARSRDTCKEGRGGGGREREKEEEDEEEEEREGGGGGRSSSHKSIDMTEAQSIDMHSQHRSAADATAVDPWVQNRLPGMSNPTRSTTGSKET